MEGQGGLAMNNRLLIRASAGSGKTFRLSGHFLQQVFLDAQPQSILATTFTRKAAGEILGRVLLRLADAAGKDAEARKLSEFLTLPGISRESALQVLVKLTQNLHRVRVCTLDSFFQQLARSLSLELGLPAGWTIIDDWMEADLQQQAIDAVLAGHATSDARELMHRLAKDRSKRSVRDLISDTVEDFYSVYQLTEPAAWTLKRKSRRLPVNDREAALRELYACDLPTDKRFIKARAEDIERFQAERWDEFLCKGIAAKVFQQADVYYGKQISQEVEAAYQPLVDHAQAELFSQLARQNEAVRDLIARFDHEYSQLQHEHGWLRFSDVTRALARSTTAIDAERIAFRLDQSIRHLLLDEFQDTSPDQWRILKSLTTTLTQGDAGNTFFCVGDPKQAIYGWRGGEAAILDAVERTVADLASEPLDKSRRSSPVVIDSVNRIFRHVADHSNLGEYSAACRQWVDEFPEHDTALQDLPGYVRFATSPASGGDSKNERRLDYIPWVAEQLRDLHARHPGAQIGVLTRRNETVARLVHALTELGVPASEEGGTPPVDSPAVLAFLSLLHLASHPGCTVSRFHVANSPLANVVKLVDWRDDQQAQRVAADLRARLLDDGYGYTLQSLVQQVKLDCSRRDRMRLRQVVAAGWQFDGSPSLNPSDFVRLLETSRFASADVAAVRVMTIHQSKGLEFDVVVLPELDADIVRTPAVAVGRQDAEQPPDRVCIWRSQALLPMLPKSLQEAFHQTRDRQITESLCLLYVALTRAVHALHLLAMPITSSKLPRTFQGLLVAALTEDGTAEPETVLYESGDPEWYHSVPGACDRITTTSETTEAVSQLSLQPMPDGRRRGLTRKAPSRHDEQRLYIHTDPKQRTPTFDQVSPLVRGTVMHVWFEAVEWLDDTSRPDPLLLRDRVAGLALSESVLNALLPDFYAYLDKESVRQALAAEATGLRLQALISSDSAVSLNMTVHNERSFAYLSDNAVIQGSIDRLVLAEHGGRIVAAEVLDFKTDRLFGDRKGWLRDRSEHYAAQLQEYRNAVTRCFDLRPASIATRLVFVEAGEMVTVNGHV
jgi:ATP-dependent helicase/nuclease subunit A